VAVTDIPESASAPAFRFNLLPGNSIQPHALHRAKGFSLQSGSLSAKDSLRNNLAKSQPTVAGV